MSTSHAKHYVATSSSRHECCLRKHYLGRALFGDLFMRAVRADEANHRDVNHIFSGMHQDQDVPFDANNKVPKNMVVPGAPQAQQQAA